MCRLLNASTALFLVECSAFSSNFTNLSAIDVNRYTVLKKKEVGLITKNSDSVVERMLDTKCVLSVKQTFDSIAKLREKGVFYYQNIA